MDRIVLLLLFAVFVFASPFTDWWLSTSSPWYLPYALWALLIALVAWTGRRRGRRDL